MLVKEWGMERVLVMVEAKRFGGGGVGVGLTGWMAG